MDTTPEITTVPVAGRGAHLGAMAYFAVLAYPKPQEWPKRNELVEALKAHLSKAYIARGGERRKVLPKYRGMKNEKIEKVLDKAFYRIKALRLPAAKMAYWKMIHGQRVGPFLIKLKQSSNEGNIGLKRFAQEYPSWEPTTITECARRMAAMLDVARQDWEQHCHEDTEFVWDEKNILHRVWASTKTVLHLAMFFPHKGERKVDVFRLIHDPSWLTSTLANAEALRRILPQFIHRYDSEKAIRLLPIPSNVRNTLGSEVATNRADESFQKKENR